MRKPAKSRLFLMPNPGSQDSPELPLESGPQRCVQIPFDLDSLPDVKESENAQCPDSDGFSSPPPKGTLRSRISRKRNVIDYDNSCVATETEAAELLRKVYVTCSVFQYFRGRCSIVKSLKIYGYSELQNPYSWVQIPFGAPTKLSIEFLTSYSEVSPI